MFRRGPSPSRATPRHLAHGELEAPASPSHRAPGPALRRPTAPRTTPRHRVVPGAAQPALRIDLALEPDELEVAPVARVQRSRLAFAAAITLAALPVLVLDNLPATAETNDAHIQANSVPAEDSSSSEPSTTASTELATTTVAPTTSTTSAPVTTTTEAPTTTAAPVRAMQATAPVAPPPTSPPATSPPATSAPRGADPNDPATWDRLAQCESGGNWAMNNGNGYYGGLQFSLATWQQVGGSGYPHQASRAEQIKRGQILQARAGWGQWPYCSRKLGYM